MYKQKKISYLEPTTYVSFLQSLRHRGVIHERQQSIDLKKGCIRIWKDGHKSCICLNTKISINSYYKCIWEMELKCQIFSCRIQFFKTDVIKINKVKNKKKWLIDKSHAQNNSDTWQIKGKASCRRAAEDGLPLSFPTSLINRTKVIHSAWCHSSCPVCKKKSFTF